MCARDPFNRFDRVGKGTLRFIQRRHDRPLPDAALPIAPSVPPVPAIRPSLGILWESTLHLPDVECQNRESDARGGFAWAAKSSIFLWKTGTEMASAFSFRLDPFPSGIRPSAWGMVNPINSLG